MLYATSSWFLETVPKKHRSPLGIASNPIVEAYAIHIGILTAKARNLPSLIFHHRSSVPIEVSYAFQSFAVSAAKSS
jgi:hypothetical protein